MNHPVRASIQAALDRFFGRRIEADERAMQALALTDDSDGWTAASSLCVLQATLGAYPLLGNVLQAEGADLNQMKYAPMYPFGTLPAAHVEAEGDDLAWEIERSLDTWFTDPESPKGFSDVFYEVVATGKLSALQVVRSCLQTTWLEGGLGDDPPAVNDIAGELIRALQTDRTGGRQRLRSLEESIAQPYEIDRDHGDQQFVLFHSGQGVSIRPFGVFGGFQLQEQSLADGSLWVARGNALQPSTRFSEEAIAALEDLINSDAPERDFQEFFEANEEFLISLGNYSGIRSQLVLTEEDGSQLIPDFFLEKYASMADICDLKRSNVELVRAQRNRTRFRDAVMEAVAQLRHYRAYFDDSGHRRAFRDRYGLDAFRPNVVVIIGRRHSFEDDIQRITLESDLPRWVSLQTYDDVVARARTWRSIVSKAAEPPHLGN